MIEPGAVAALLSNWWIVYDQAEFDAWPDLVHPDIEFESRSDSGRAANESVIAGSGTGAEAFLAWHRQHRLAAPFPLAHQMTNLYLTRVAEEEADFRCNLVVTKVGEAGNTVFVSSVLGNGTVCRDGEGLRIKRKRSVVYKTPSRPLSQVLDTSAIR